MMMKSPQVKLCYLAVVIGEIISNCAVAAEATNANSHFELASVSQTDFGGVGLLQTPTARMADTGEFSASYRDNDPYRRYAISLQMLDWLETTVRYTDIRTRLYSNHSDFSGDQTYKDKAFDLKARLWQESFWVPQISLGMRDIAGTGLFDSEYLVANKKAGPFDFSLGLGWGNMAEGGNISNPFCSYKESFCQRARNTETGQFEVKNFFHGPAGLFGGVEYQTPWNPLRLKLEYDANDYTNEAGSRIKQDSNFNYGLVYRATDWLDTSLSYERGNTFMWGFTLRTNFNKLYSNFIDDPRPVYAPHPAASNKDVDWNQASKELEQYSGYRPVAVYEEHKQITIVADQTKYRDEKESNQRAAAVLANHLPQTIEQVNITTTNKNQPIKQTQIDTAATHSQLNGVPFGEPEPEIYKSAPIKSAQSAPVWKQNPERLNLSAEPTLAQSFGGPESFYMYQVGAKGNADYYLTDNLIASGTLNLNIINNYDQFNYKTPPADTNALPRVRTWVREYITSSDVLLTNLQLTRIDNPAQDWYSQIYAGYLEMMYAGTGSEVLYKPYGRSWAVGVDANYVKQRDWNDIMQLADYDVFTGHLTTYWELPFVKGGLAKISAGQYLAGDKGVTVDLSRQFDSGIIAGAYLTKTNVSAADYGEGSFTKGFYISIPLDLMLAKPTKQRGTISWMPLTRDGGQILGKKYGLYGLTNN